jgi:hypothetical protein
MLSTYEFPHSIDTVYYELTDRDRLMKRYDALGEEVISFHSVHVGLELILTVDRRIHRDVPKVLRNVINSAQVKKCLKSGGLLMQTGVANITLRLSGNQ